MTIPYPRGSLIAKTALRVGLGFPMIALLLILPAGTWNYWQSWLFLGLLFAVLLILGGYLLLRAPEALERRMRMRERDPAQQKIITWALAGILPVFILPGLDVRFGWSQVPPWVSLAAELVIGLSFILYGLVMRENHYAGRIIEVEKGQKVISSGPYALVRHPMYLSVSLMYLALPLALGSYWAFLPALLLPLVLVARIGKEEAFLAKELPGYAEYTQKVRYRLIPGVW